MRAGTRVLAAARRKASRVGGQASRWTKEESAAGLPSGSHAAQPRPALSGLLSPAGRAGAAGWLRSVPDAIVGGSGMCMYHRPWSTTRSGAGISALSLRACRRAASSGAVAGKAGKHAGHASSNTDLDVWEKLYAKDYEERARLAHFISALTELAEVPARSNCWCSCSAQHPRGACGCADADPNMPVRPALSPLCVSVVALHTRGLPLSRRAGPPAVSRQRAGPQEENSRSGAEGHGARRAGHGSEPSEVRPPPGAWCAGRAPLMPRALGARRGRGSACRTPSTQSALASPRT
jgi:hypothetical protein